MISWLVVWWVGWLIDWLMNPLQCSVETESKVVHAFRSFEAESGVHVSKWRWCGDFPPGLEPKYFHAGTVLHCFFSLFQTQKPMCYTKLGLVLIFAQSNIRM